MRRVEVHRDVLALGEAIDNGKPYAVARIADLPLTVDVLRYMGGWATKVTGTTIPLSLPSEYLSYTVGGPVEVVGQIIPCNFDVLNTPQKQPPAKTRPRMSSAGSSSTGGRI